MIKKRDGTIVLFNREKISSAILKAMQEVFSVNLELADGIAKEIENELHNTDASIYDIEEMVIDKLKNYGYNVVSIAYKSYRDLRTQRRLENSTDEAIVGLLEKVNKDVLNENSNKNGNLNSTQRDLIAGEVSKDLALRKLLPIELSNAHKLGIIHMHDLDYAIQPMHNCCLVNISDMLDNGTVINGKLIESPKSFQVACTIVTQVIAQVASSQYGGQSVDLSHLGKYVTRSRDKYTKMLEGTITNKEELSKTVETLLLKEVKSGVQTIQYQINTLMTTNGQSPFVTIFMNLDSNTPYQEEVHMIFKAVLESRLEGIKNEVGVWITPAFPKLIYVLNEDNIREGSKFYSLTELAAKCTAKRMYPDYISAKKFKDIYEGEVYSPMGCRSMLPVWRDSEGKAVFEGRFNFGVQTLNLPRIALMSEGDIDKFFTLLDKNLQIIKKAGMWRYEHLKDIPSDVSPIHWQHGAIARLEKGETIGSLLKGGYAATSCGYIGLHETVTYLIGESITTDRGHQLAIEILRRIKVEIDSWLKETGLKFTLYGTPAESIAGRLCELDRKQFGVIEGVTDKGYYTNSYHVTPSEEIDAFHKLELESPFQSISTGGCISYVEIPNMANNIEALISMMQFMYDNISYAEFNTKSDYCHICGFDGEIIVNDDLEWECPQCNNKDTTKMNVVRRTCGYLGENFWSEGRTKDIKDRVLHI